MKHLLFFFFAIVLMMCSCKSEITQNETSNELGEININVDTNEKAKDAFYNGLLLMHSFEYEDAATYFKEAQNLDPTFGLAYWGEAMTKNHPLWREQEQVEALEILSRFGNDTQERLAKISDPFEKDLFKAAEVLYGAGTKKIKGSIIHGIHGRLT